MRWGKPSRRVKRLTHYKNGMRGSLNAATSHAVGDGDGDCCGWLLCGIGAGCGGAGSEG